MSERKRRHFSGTEKVQILKRHLVEKTPISDLCDEFGLYPNVSCYGPNCGRIFDRIVTVEISGLRRGFDRIVENSGEGIVSRSDPTG